MKESLERIQELLSDLTDALIRGEDRIGLVENYRTEIRDEALAEKKCCDRCEHCNGAN